MKIFISWSGPRSYLVAAKLKEWLPLVLQGSEPWLSTEDIRKGSRWQADMSEALAKPSAGILCLTRDNLASSWLAFEAGAISNASIASSGYVCTYLIDLTNADIGLPLGMFQSTTADRDDTWRLVRHLNSRTEPLPEDRLAKLFDTFWPELEQVIADAKQTPAQQQTNRPEAEMLKEILETVRGLARRATPDQTAAGLGDIIKSLAETPGSSTFELFRRLEQARNRVLAAQTLEKIENKIGDKSDPA